MIDDGRSTGSVPDVVLGQHVAPLPAGLLGVTSPGVRRRRLAPRGAARPRRARMPPESAVDPVLMAAATVQRLHAIVSRNCQPPTPPSSR